MSKHRRALGSSSLDAIGVDSSDHPVDKLLRGKVTTTRDYNMPSPEVGTYLGPIIAWKCTRCKRVWSTSNTPEMGTFPCSVTGVAHSLEPVRAPR